MKTLNYFGNWILPLAKDGPDLAYFEQREVDELIRLSDRVTETRLAFQAAFRSLEQFRRESLLTSIQVANELGIPLRLVWEMAAQGTTPVRRANGQVLVFGLPAVKVGRQYRFPRSAIEQILGRPIRGGK